MRNKIKMIKLKKEKEENPKTFKNRNKMKIQM